MSNRRFTGAIACVLRTLASGVGFHFYLRWRRGRLVFGRKQLFGTGKYLEACLGDALLCGILVPENAETCFLVTLHVYVVLFASEDVEVAIEVEVE